MDTYRQVELVKEHGATQVWDIVWIPKKLAVKGKVLRKKGANRLWSDGWKIVAVYTTEVASEVIEARSRDHRNMPTFEEAKDER